MNITSFALTHAGNKRQYNQDAYFCDDNNGIWAVADGMGGHESGDIASQTIIQSIANLTLGDRKNIDILTINSILEDVNEQLYKQNQANQQIMGSTLALVFIEDTHAICLWAGDSRVYLLRQGHFIQVSTDHSYVQELKNKGTFLDSEASHKKNNVITRAIGPNADLKFDFLELEIQANDKFLICSDGLYNEISKEEISAVIQYSDDLKIAGNNLLDLCLSREAKDNVSLVLIGVTP
jgi:serine/threonine protein phosphatase PrpC